MLKNNVTNFQTEKGNVIETLIENETTTVSIQMPTWVFKRIKALAEMQKITPQSWINRSVYKTLKSNLKIDKIKWIDIYETVSEEDFSEEELMDLLREVFKKTVLHGIERENHSFSSSDEYSSKGDM